LHSLDLSRNPIGDNGVASLAELLEGQSSTINELHLFAIELTDRCAIILAKSLRQNSTLRHLDLSFNSSITDDCVNYFIEMIGQNQTQLHICLGNCGISKKGKVQLRQAARDKTISLHL
jgi:Ran GTPase-activating protein (RanGAP) involved in mRNA processing and transport